MAAFTAKDVAALREKTGCGMMDCKNALKDANGNFDEAIKILREKGIAASAKKQLKQLTELGFDKLPICMAKTQFSFSDDASKLGAPRGFKITVRDLKVNAGAGFLVAKTGDIMTMPGLPKVPSAEKIDVDENGKITGLF